MSDSWVDRVPITSLPSMCLKCAPNMRVQRSCITACHLNHECSRWSLYNTLSTEIDCTLSQCFKVAWRQDRKVASSFGLVSLPWVMCFRACKRYLCQDYQWHNIASLLCPRLNRFRKLAEPCSTYCKPLALETFYLLPRIHKSNWLKHRHHHCRSMRIYRVHPETICY